jgi:hypothetical protein
VYFDRNRRAYVLKSTACIEFVSVYSSTFLSPGPSLPVVVPAVFFRFPPFLVLFFWLPGRLEGHRQHSRLVLPLAVCLAPCMYTPYSNQ